MKFFPNNTKGKAYMLVWGSSLAYYLIVLNSGKILVRNKNIPGTLAKWQESLEDADAWLEKESRTENFSLREPTQEELEKLEVVNGCYNIRS